MIGVVSGKGFRAYRQPYWDCLLCRGSGCFSLHVWHCNKAPDFPFLMVMADAYFVQEESFNTAVKSSKIYYVLWVYRYN